MDRNALSSPAEECETLSRDTGLSFIPLYSPSCHRPHSSVQGHTSTLDLDSSFVDSPAANHDDSFTEEEITLFQTRYENGYDISGDDRYRQWLCKSHPDATLSMSFRSTSVRKHLSCPSPPSRIPSVKPKSCGRVLTSVENIKIIEEKERVKKGTEEAKMAREEAKRKKALLKLLTGTASECLVHIQISGRLFFGGIVVSGYVFILHRGRPSLSDQGSYLVSEGKDSKCTIDQERERTTFH